MADQRDEGLGFCGHGALIDEYLLDIELLREPADAEEHVHKMTSWHASSYARASIKVCLCLVIDAEDTRLRATETSPGSSCRNQAEAVLP